MTTPTVIVHFNHKTRLFILEFINGDSKSLTPAPRWVQSRQTLEIWINDRINDNTFPNDIVITYE